jgi:hypothetical protein
MFVIYRFLHMARERVQFYLYTDVVKSKYAIYLVAGENDVSENVFLIYWETYCIMKQIHDTEGVKPTPHLSIHL